MPDRIPRQFGNYRVIARLTNGGEAVIYQGRSPTGELVAIRALPMHTNTAAAQRDFEAEVRKLQQLSHPYVIPLKDCGMIPGHAYLVMPYIPDGSLADRAGKGLWPAFDDALEYIKQAGQALSYIHAKGFVHRDVKPHNLLLRNSGILLSDFGIAIGQTTVPIENVRRRTRRFCAPEQAAGQATSASDQYALAATASWLLTKGQFHTPEEELKHLRSMHSGIASVLARALEAEPARRYPNMVEFLRALDRAALSSGASRQLQTEQQPFPVQPKQEQQPFPAQSEPRKQPRRLRLLAVVIVAAVVLLGVAGVLIATTYKDLGGVDLIVYCHSLHYEEPVEVASDWYCSGQATLKITMAQACNWQYLRNNLTAETTDPHNPYNWRCYDPQHNQIGGIKDMKGYCTSQGYDEASPNGNQTADWSCQRPPQRNIDMTQVCVLQYHRSDAQARQIDNNNWECYGLSILG